MVSFVVSEELIATPLTSCCYQRLYRGDLDLTKVTLLRILILSKVHLLAFSSRIIFKVAKTCAACSSNCIFFNNVT